MNTRTPIVSIVIPVHNRENLLPETLDSVQAQTFTDWECVIVDDHSTDGSLAVAQRYASADSRFRSVSLPDPKRYGNAARNYGLSLARGEYVNFLDSDDLFVADKLELQLAVFQQNHKLDAVTCRHALFTGTFGKQFKYLRFAAPNSWLDVIWFTAYEGHQGGIWSSAGPLWRIDSIRDLGAWNEGLRIWQDMELNVRAMARGLHIQRLERVLVFVRAQHGNRVTDSRFTVEFVNHQRHSIIVSWGQLRHSKKDTEIRRRLVAAKLLSIRKNGIKNIETKQLLKDWYSDCTQIDLPFVWILVGALIIVLRKFEVLYSITKRLDRIFCYPIKHLPSAMPKND